MWPSLGSTPSSFENAGYLYVFDLASAANQAHYHASRRTRPDHETLGQRQQERHRLDIAPDGKRAVFAARGDVFTVPAKEGAPAISPTPPAFARKGSPGLPTGAGSPSFPTAPARKSSTSLLRMAWAILTWDTDVAERIRASTKRRTRTPPPSRGCPSERARQR